MRDRLRPRLFRPPFAAIILTLRNHQQGNNSSQIIWVMVTTVLIVEDDRDFGEAVAANLEGAGYRVLGPARSGTEAFGMLEPDVPEVAFVDITLEGAFDGVFLGQQLAERGIRVIYLTARFDRALSEGRSHAVGMLAKPCRSADLVQAVEAALEHPPVSSES